MSGSLEFVDFITSGTDVTTVSEVGADPSSQHRRVTHRFRPSSQPDLFQVDVTVQNVGFTAATNLHYCCGSTGMSAQATTSLT